MTTVLVVCLAALAVPAYLVFRSSDVETSAPSTTTPSTTRPVTQPSTTSTTVPPTVATTSTLPPPPAVAPVPGITVGTLTDGPGPIPIVHRVPTLDPVVFITIDDGVTPDPGALQVIRDQHVPVTLFLTQMYMKANADYFRQLQAAGAVIESHSITHTNLRGKDEATQQREICGPSADYAGRFGVTPDLFRPPYGKWDDATIRLAAGCGMRAVVHWSATFDAGTLSTMGGPLRPGDIILLHFKPGLGLGLQALLAQIQASGLRPAQLADYIRSAPPAPVPPIPTPGAPAPAPSTAPPLPEGDGAVTG